MKVPSNFLYLLERRRKLALLLLDVSSAVDTWLISKGIDLNDPQLGDATLSGCMINAEPDTAKDVVLQYVSNYIKEDK